MLTHRRWSGALPLLATIMVAALVALAGAWQHQGRSAHRTAMPGTAPLAGAADPSLCVTRHGLCRTAAPLPVDEPCGCPHPLHGTVPGHARRLGAGGWPERDADGPPAAPGLQGDP